MGVEDLAGWCASRYDGDWAVGGGGGSWNVPVVCR